MSDAEHAEEWTKFDSTLVWVIALVGVVTAIAVSLAPHFHNFTEDAVILFLYSRNLAHTGAITYFQNGPHAEGATDFAWMVLIAGGFKLHIPPEWTVAFCNVASLLLLPLLLTRIAGVRLRPIPALFIMGAFGLMPQIEAAILGFSVLPFACLLALMALCFVRRNDLAMALSCLLLCLFRPDGVVFALPMLLGALIIFDGRMRRAAIFAAAFAAPGVCYFLWRWHYFNCLLPLPFLVKSNTQRFAHLIVGRSVQDGAFLCVFTFALAWFVRYKSGRLSSPSRTVLICMLLLPNLFYFAMRLEQNNGRRFFIYLPLSAAVFLAVQWPRVRSNRALVLRVGVALWLVFICRLWFSSVDGVWRPQFFDNREAIAKDLSTLPRGTLIVSEAGILPYYSNWKTYDAWGLNTAQFAKRLIQPSDIASIQPDAIMFYAGAGCVRGADWQTPYTFRSWLNMTRNVTVGADPAEYDLWYVPYGNTLGRASAGIKTWQGDQECWYVRRFSPLSGSIADVLSRHGGLPANLYQQALQSTNPPPPVTLPASRPGAAEHHNWLRSSVSWTYRWWRKLTE